jgi:hypothetical protein
MVALLFPVFALSALALWYLRPVLIWRFTVRPRLEAHANATRLHATTLTDFEAPEIDWSRIAVGNFSIRAPLVSVHDPLCSACSDHCVLAIEQGTLAIFRALPDESFEEAIALWAPDARDISWRRPRSDNWRTLESLADRVVSDIEPTRSIRFLTPRSKGVATISAIGDRNRLIVYAYSVDGTPARILGLTGTAMGPLYRALGSLEVDAAGLGAADGNANCSTEST